MSEHDAMLWEPDTAQAVRCRLCGHQCHIVEGRYGLCRVRVNRAGRLKTLNYGLLVALNVDPIEKKPLFHFLPGSRSLSIAAAGCNFQCEFCQNWQISQSPRGGGGIDGEPFAPEDVVKAALRESCRSISYTYTEPTVYFEFAYDTARLARQHGLRNVFVSNGYMTPSAVEMIAPHLDAINVDLKAFSDATYQRIMKARLEPVLTCLKELVARKVWVEVTTLVVPGMNDSDKELRDIAEFIARKLSPQVPWHVSRFHGDYRMTSVSSTPVETLRRACRTGAQAGLDYVYCGNVPGEASERTICPKCGDVVVDRVGFSVRRIDMRDGCCGRCGRPIAGIWR